MHDTVGLEIDGIPAVFVASDEFGDAVEVQAEALGLQQVHRVLVPHPIQDATDGEIESRADAAIDSLLDALIR